MAKGMRGGFGKMGASKKKAASKKAWDTRRAKYGPSGSKKRAAKKAGPKARKRAKVSPREEARRYRVKKTAQERIALMGGPKKYKRTRRAVGKQTAEKLKGTRRRGFAIGEGGATPMAQRTQEVARMASRELEARGKQKAKKRAAPKKKAGPRKDAKMKMTYSDKPSKQLKQKVKVARKRGRARPYR